MAATIPAPTRAVTFDRLTYLTFSRAVQVPGATLEPGTYQFRLANPETSRNILQVLSRDGHKAYAMFSTFGDRRMVATDEPTVTFRETPAGAPPMVKSLFYGGELNGYAFVYPKDQTKVSKIAIAIEQERGKSQPPPAAIVTETTQQIQQPAAHADTSASAQTETAGQSATAAAETTVTRAEPAPAPQESPAASSAAVEQRTTSNARAVGTAGQLPRTATALPWVGFGGLSALVVGLGVTLFSKRLS